MMDVSPSSESKFPKWPEQIPSGENMTVPVSHGEFEDQMRIYGEHMANWMPITPSLEFL